MERRWSVPIISALAALLAVVLVAPGLGPVTGAIPNKGGAYSACLTKSTGAVEVINYPKVRCSSGQRLITWNAKGQTGAQGPAGAQGPQGVDGAQGPQGPAGPADWNAIPNKPAGFADGVDDIGNPGYVTQTVPCDNPIAAGGEYVVFENLPRNMFHEFQVVSTDSGDSVYIDFVLWQQTPDGSQSASVRVRNGSGIGGSGACNVRRISFTQGISVAKAKKQLTKVKVGYPR